MKRLILFLFTIAVLASGSAQSQELSMIPGSFVDIGFGTRPVGMGFAFVGLADDENSPYWNPAGLTQINEIKAGFSQADQLGLITYNYASATMPIPGQNHAVGISVISSGDEAMEELSIHAAYGIRFNIVSLGVALKYRNASFGNNSLNRDDYVVFDDDEIDTGFGQQVFGDANGIGLDLGLLIQPSDYVQLGVVLRDAYAPMSWNSEARSVEYQARGKYDEELPYELIIGSALTLSKNFLAVVDFQPATSSERTNWVRAGVEGRLVNVLMIRAGTEQGINEIDDDRFTLGTGLDIRIKDKIRVQSDFAYVIDPIQNSQRISFTISF